MLSTEEVKRSFQVELEVVRRHVFVVEDANSPDEAEMIAEQLLDEGEEGAILEEEITNVDSFPVSKEDIN